MLFSWLRRRRRRNLLAAPFPPAWHEYLRRNVPHYAHLTEPQRAKLRDDVWVFVATKHWEGCRGLAITEEIQVTIAAQACLLTLGFDDNLYGDIFGRFASIVVHPASYVVPAETPLSDGVSLHGYAEELGEATPRGAVVLSWADVREGVRDAADGVNLAFHEFAHQIDMRTGATEGVPSHLPREVARRWETALRSEFDEFVRAVDDGEKTLLDEYGATDLAEFFAVASEYFFERPAPMRRRQPTLYALLREFYRQDPAARIAQPRP
jgi:hypothetical protein